MTCPALERIAETHYFIRPQLVGVLQKFSLSENSSKHLHGCKTYHEYWTKSRSAEFFDMATLLRIASAIETFLREVYCSRKGYGNQLELKQDEAYERGAFQRIMPWQKCARSAQALFASIGIDLPSFPEFSRIQELFLHRHLYAHQLGVLDDDYIENLKTLTGVDIRQHPVVKEHYPREDVYWFQPLDRIPEFIEGARKFVSAFK